MKKKDTLDKTLNTTIDNCSIGIYNIVGISFDIPKTVALRNTYIELFSFNTMPHLRPIRDFNTKETMALILHIL